MSQTHPDHARRTGPALEAMQRFMVWLIPTVEKFPRSQKFLLGDRIQATALDVLERLIEATYTKARRPALLQANLGIARNRTVRAAGHADTIALVPFRRGSLYRQNRRRLVIFWSPRKKISADPAFTDCY